MGAPGCQTPPSLCGGEGLGQSTARRRRGAASGAGAGPGGWRRLPSWSRGSRTGPGGLPSAGPPRERRVRGAGPAERRRRRAGPGGAAGSLPRACRGTVAVSSPQRRSLGPACAAALPRPLLSPPPGLQVSGDPGGGAGGRRGTVRKGQRVSSRRAGAPLSPPRTQRRLTGAVWRLGSVAGPRPRRAARGAGGGCGGGCGRLPRPGREPSRCLTPAAAAGRRRARLAVTAALRAAGHPLLHCGERAGPEPAPPRVCEGAALAAAAGGLGREVKFRKGPGGSRPRGVWLRLDSVGVVTHGLAGGGSVRQQQQQNLMECLFLHPPSYRPYLAASRKRVQWQR